MRAAPAVTASTASSASRPKPSETMSWTALSARYAATTAGSRDSVSGSMPDFTRTRGTARPSTRAARTFAACSFKALWSPIADTTAPATGASGRSSSHRTASSAPSEWP